MRYLSALLLLPALVLGDAPDKISIGSVTHSGNGCPQNSVSTSVSPDRTVITFGFDQFQTYIGPGTAPQDRTKNCQLHLNLNYPSGWSFAVINTVYHGYAQLESGVTGTFLTTYFFSANAAQTTTTRTTISGGGVWAQGDVYTKSDEVPFDSVIKSPCGGSSAILNINNRISLTSSNSRAGGTISDDDATVDLSQQVRIQWYRC